MGAACLTDVFPTDSDFAILAPKGSEAINYAERSGIRSKIDESIVPVPDDVPDTETDAGFFEYSEVEDGIAVTAYTGTEQAVYIPSYIDGKKVVKISSFFPKGKQHDMLKAVRIPDGVKMINGLVFSGCIRLKKAVLPESLETIGARAFQNCNALESINLPSSLKNIDDHAFNYCSSLKAADIPDDLVRTGDYSFANCSALERISLPDSLEYLGKSAFSGCTSLKEVSLPSGLKTIEDYTFVSCSELEGIDLPDSLEVIGRFAFYGCEKIRDVVFPEELKSIGDYAFYSCGSIESIAIPDSVTMVGNNAFAKCGNIENVKLSAKMKYVSTGMLEQCISLEYIKIPKNIIEIEPGAFRSSGLKRVELTEGLKNINACAFSQSAICEPVVVPASVGQIGDEAFDRIQVDEIIILGERTVFGARSVGYKWIDYNAVVNEDYIITAKSGSKAEEYAKSIGLKFRDIDTGAITSYKIEPTDLTFSCGRHYHEFNLWQQIKPDNASNKELIWTSSDESLAVVEKGIMFAKVKGVMYDGKYKDGIVTITATAVNGLSASVKLMVYSDPPYPNMDPNGIYLISDPVTMMPEEKFHTSSIPIMADNISWSSSNNNVAVVSNEGIVNAVGAGKATITGSNENGVIIEFEVTVESPYIPVKSVTLNSTSKTVGAGESLNLKATATPSDATNKVLTWTSSNTAVAAVSGGRVTAKKAGTATITAETANGKKASCTVTVKNAPSKVTLSKTKKTIGAGESYTLKATLPDGTASGVRKWTSSDTSVVTVKDGALTAKKTGTATITVRTFNGKTASCLITVKKAPSKVTLNKTKKTIGAGESYTLKATLPDGTASGVMKWTTSNSSVVTVKDGTLTAKKTGTATITVKTFNGKTASCVITVKKAPSKITLNKTGLTMKKGGTYTLKATLPDGTASGTRTWTTSNSAVVTVKDGALTAKKAGTATITVKTYNGSIAKCKVTVK